MRRSAWLTEDLSRSISVQKRVVCLMFSRVNETGGRFTCISWLVHIHGGLHWVTVPKLQLKDVQSKVLKTTAICWLEWEDVMARGHPVGDTDNWELEQPNSAKVQHDTVTAQTQPNDALTRERVWRARHIFPLVLLSLAPSHPYSNCTISFMIQHKTSIHTQGGTVYSKGSSTTLLLPQPTPMKLGSPSLWK